MKISTIWVVIEKNRKNLTEFIYALNKAYNKHDILFIDQDKAYQYGIRDFKKIEDFWFGEIVKYGTNKKVSSFDPNTRSIVEEKISNYPLIEHAFFGIDEHFILLEEKRPNLGQRQMLEIIKGFSKDYIKKIAKYEFEFKNSEETIEEFLRFINRLEIVRFTNIGVNPNPSDERIKVFEELTKDTKPSIIEFKNVKKGLNRDSRIINGGMGIVKEQKADVHIDAIDIENRRTTYDSKAIRAKDKKKIEYEPEERESKIIYTIKGMLRRLRNRL